MKTTYTAWAVQVLRDGEWRWKRCANEYGEQAHIEAYPTESDASKAAPLACSRRVRKVRVTVEEV